MNGSAVRRACPSPKSALSCQGGLSLVKRPPRTLIRCPVLAMPTFGLNVVASTCLPPTDFKLGNITIRQGEAYSSHQTFIQSMTYTMCVRPTDFRMEKPYITWTFSIHGDSVTAYDLPIMHLGTEDLAIGMM